MQDAVYNSCFCSNLENMLFAEGTYVTKNQVLFVINQDQYRAKADKVRAQLKKDEAQALKAKRDLERQTEDPEFR